MRPVVVLIFHAAAPKDTGPLVRALAEARHSLANRRRDAFLAAGADVAEVVARSPDGLSFGERLAAEIRARTGRAGGTGGVVVLGSGSIPLARAADLRRFVEVAAGPGGHALANNRYSADVVAVSRAADLAELPPLPADNALPRWLEERAGVAVSDLRSRWRLGVDVDTPLDLLVLGLARTGFTAAPLIGERLAALSDVLTNRRAELLVAGRISATTLRWLESGVACRVRALSKSAAFAPPAISPNQEPRPSPGRRAPSSGSCSTATAPNPSPAPSPRWPMPRSSTRASCWPIATAPTSRPGRRRRIASPRTCWRPRPSPIRGCGPSRNLRPPPTTRSSSADTRW